MQFCSKSRRNEFFPQGTLATTNVEGQDNEREVTSPGDQTSVQWRPGIDVNMTEVSLEPHLLANMQELLVDEEESRGRACGRGFLEHLCCVHDAGDETIAAVRERMAEDCCEEILGEVVEGGFGAGEMEVGEVGKGTGCHAVLLPFEGAVSSHCGDGEVV